MKQIIISLSLLFLIGCSNPYSQSYQDVPEGLEMAEHLESTTFDNEPMLIEGTDIEGDILLLREEGYILIGVSNFNAGKIDQNLAIEQGKIVCADLIYTYKEYTNTITNIVPITTPETETTYHSGNVYGSGFGSASYSGTSTTYGTKTTYHSYNINKYDYLATYWIEASLPLGAYVSNLSDEQRYLIESNKGVTIVLVVNDSPAFSNDLLVGDIILKMNDVEITDYRHFNFLIRRNKGKPITLEIYRNGNSIVKEIQLN